MIYRMRTYVAVPEQLDAFNSFFLDRLLPIQLHHGARLVGRWVSEDSRDPPTGKDAIQVLAWWLRRLVVATTVRNGSWHCTARHNESCERPPLLSPVYFSWLDAPPTTRRLLPHPFHLRRSLPQLWRRPLQHQRKRRLLAPTSTSS